MTLDPEARRILLNKACNEYRRGAPCVQRKPTSKMVAVDGQVMHRACAEVDDQLRRDGGR